MGTSLGLPGPPWVSWVSLGLPVPLWVSLGLPGPPWASLGLPGPLLSHWASLVPGLLGPSPITNAITTTTTTTGRVSGLPFSSCQN